MEVLLHCISLCSMQMDLMKWLFTGELAFDMLFSQLSVVGRLHSYICFSSTLLYNSPTAMVQTPPGLAEQLREQCTGTMCRLEHFSVLSTNETRELRHIFILQDRNFYTYFSRNKRFIWVPQSKMVSASDLPWWFMARSA